MYSSLLRKINTERQEAGFTLVLFLSAILLGIYLGTFDIVAHTIFFEKWQQEDMILAYVLSGIFGIFLFFIYSILHKRVSFKVFNFINLTLIFLITLIYFFLYLTSPDEWIVFGSLVIMFPLNLLSLLTFWRYYRKLLLPVQTKRLFPLLETGVAVGIMISAGLTIVVLVYAEYSLLSVIALLSVGILFLFQFPVNYYHKRSTIFQHQKELFVPVPSSLFILWTSKYTRFLLLFALTSSVLGFYIHFGYFNLLKIRNYEIDKLALYYCIFIGTMFLFIWITERFLVHRILYSHDSPYSLALLPIGIGVFFILSLVGIFILKKSGFNDPLPILIILFGINKVVYETSKYTIQLPSFRALYRTLDIRFLQIIYPRIEGMVVMLGMLVTGGLLMILYKAVTDLILYCLIGLTISGTWFYLMVKLIKSYKVALQDSYRKLRISHTVDPYAETYTTKIRRILVGDNPVKVINAMRLSAAVEPLTYEKSLQRMLANPQPDIQGYVLKCIKKELLVELLPELKKVTPESEDSAVLLKEIVHDFEQREQTLNQSIDLEQLVNSRNVREKVMAAEIIGARKDLTYTSSLINLTREFEPDVKIAAVKAMARMSAADHSYLLIEFLSSPEYQAYAFEALVQIGDPAIDYLERLFLNPNTNDTILSRVIRIYGKIGSGKAVELLLNKLDNQSRRISLATISALHEANFQANSMNVHRILNIIVRTINVMGWNFLVISSLPEKEEYAELKQSYLLEIEMNYDLLFDLLSLAYNSKTIREIRELLENGASADISHAIEMLDHFIIEDIKPVLFPVIEDISIKEKVKRLQYYFAIETMTTEEIVASTLTRDYNILCLYPRICAMHIAFNMPEFEVNQELIANIFHPNRLIREVAALVIFKKDPSLFDSVIQRLDPQIQFEIKEAISAFEKDNQLLLVDKFNLLRNTNEMASLPEWILIELAHFFEEKKFQAGQEIDLSHHLADYSLFIPINGSIDIEGKVKKISFSDNYRLFYGDMLVNSGFSKISFTRDTTLLTLSHENVQLLMYDYFEIAGCVLSCVEQFKLAG